MNRKRYVLVTTALIVPLVQAILGGSNVNWLVQLDLVFIFALVLFVRKFYTASLVFMFLSSAVIELINFEPVGQMALVFMVSVVVVYIFTNLVSLVSTDQRTTVALLILLIIQVSEFVMAQYLYSTNVFNVGAFLVNFFLLVVGILLSASLETDNYVFKK